MTLEHQQRHTRHVHGYETTDLSCDVCDGDVVYSDAEYHCDDCGIVLANSTVIDGERSYERYRNSGNWRMRGGYTDAYPTEQTQRDDRLISGGGVSL